MVSRLRSCSVMPGFAQPPDPEEAHPDSKASATRSAVSLSKPI